MIVAVVGLGSVGLVTLKNMVDAGFEVVGFEKASGVGGLWVRNNDPKVTCAMSHTRTNWSKHRMCTGDFPHPESTSLHPTQQEMADWHQQYAQHFDLLRHCKTQTTVSSVHHLASTDQYEISFTNSNSSHPQTMLVDKVFLATGLNSQPRIPVVPGIEQFGGVIKHSQAVKSGAPFKGKRCVVIGSRSSASDLCEGLVQEGASKVYLSHRGGVLVLPRLWGGRALDFWFSRRATNIVETLDSIRPYSSRWMTNAFGYLMSTTSFNFRPEWKFKPFPDSVSGVPTISDSLVPLLESRAIVSVPALASVSSPTSVTLTDGNILNDIDAILFATGFEEHRPFLLSNSTLARLASPPITDKPGASTYPLLYKGTFPPSLPSLALSLQGFSGPEGILPISDVKAMWIAGVWSGRIPLPSEDEMWESASKDRIWWEGLKQFVPSPWPGQTPLAPLLSFLAREAGCEIEDHLAYTSLKAWKWWFASGENRRLTRLLLDGMASVSVYRLWGTGKWEGARECVERANTKENYSGPGR